MHDINNVPPFPPDPPQDPSWRNHATGGLSRSAKALRGALMVLLLVGGLFIGWQWGHANAVAPGNATTDRIVTGNNDTGSPDVADSVREAVIAKFTPSVVQINVQTGNGQSLGSGVIVDKRGYIVTNNHVVEGSQRMNVDLFDGAIVPAQITGADPLDDLAVVKIDPTRVKQLAVASIGASARLHVGQTVLAIGNPLGITQTVTSGIVSALNRTVSEGPSRTIIPGAVQTDAAINPGNSGGALVDLHGQLIGVPTLIALDPELNTPANGVGFAIPSDRVKFIAPQIISTGRVSHSGRASLGIRSASVNPIIANQNNLPVDHGALIVAVTAGGPAARAGLRMNDIITEVDQQQVADISALEDALLNKSPGDTVKVHVYRESQQLNTTVTLDELSVNQQ